MRVRKRVQASESANWVKRIDWTGVIFKSTCLTNPCAGLGRGASGVFLWSSFRLVWVVSDNGMTGCEVRGRKDTVNNSLCRSSACVSACSCWWGTAGRKAVLGSHCWCGTCYKMLLEKERVYLQLLRSGQLALFSPAPKGLIIEA